MRKLWLAIYCLLHLFVMQAQENKHFYTLNTQNGLSSNTILQLLQLKDGRIVILTNVGLDIFDGTNVGSIRLSDNLYVSLPEYYGSTHLFADVQDRLWIKQRKKLACIDLRRMQQIPLTDFSASDFFIDSNEETWLLQGRRLHGDRSRRVLSIPDGNLQDVASRGDSVYTFFHSGLLAVFDKDGKKAYESLTDVMEASQPYERTSLVVQTDSLFYQVRTGTGGGLLLSFNPASRQWRRILSSNKLLHTLSITATGWLYLTSPDGYLRMNMQTGLSETFNELQLPDGTVLSTGINTVCSDRQGGYWFGTYDKGVLYTSPLSGVFDTRPIDIDVYPILTSIFLQGRPLKMNEKYNGRELLNVNPPYVEELTLNYDQNALAFQFSTMNYVRPRSTCYRYRFSGDGNEWHTISADSVENLVDDKGILYLPLVGLPPGDYSLEVMATTNPDHWNTDLVRRIRFTILPPWWRTPMAYVLYVAALLATVLLFFFIYRRRLKQRAREDMLLLRIQNLVAQINQYEQTAAKIVLSEPESSAGHEPEREPSQQEKDFMTLATSLVEKHMSDPLYNVERLAADLCMERTGLYKKLIVLIQQSPVVFIRTIRLHKAAAMLRSGNCTVADVAERTGFSSPSYFGKCFQKEFGCKPSEFIEK